MTTAPLITDPTAEAYRLIAVLEHHRQHLPFADQELARHQQLLNDLECQRRQSEGSLAAWRIALAHRWDLEVASQRLIKRTMSDIAAAYRSDEPSAQLVAPLDDGAVRTAEHLVGDLSYLASALSLLSPRPPFANERIRELELLRVQLEEAIEESHLLETHRRSAVLDLRMASRAYRRVAERTRALISSTLIDA